MQRTRTSPVESSTWETVSCPECDGLAEVQWRCELESTDGPVEHAKIMCSERHWFLLPVDRLPLSR